MIPETYAEELVKRRIETAEALRDEAIRERDAALAELAKIKHDIQWTMGKLRIADIIMHTGSDESGEGRYRGPLTPDPEDTPRMDWFNRHGRVSLGNGSFCVAFDYQSDIENAEVPTPYNIRHLLDLCRKDLFAEPEPEPQPVKSSKPKPKPADQPTLF